MTTPAITALLDSHAALLQSRELSFDEKVGYLTACLAPATGLHFQTHELVNQYGTPLSEVANTIRAAMIERQSAQLKAAAAATVPTSSKAAPATAKPARNIKAEIKLEKLAISKAANALQVSNANSYAGNTTLENLQLHITRLQALERKLNK